MRGLYRVFALAAVLSMLGASGVCVAGEASYEKLLEKAKSGDETVDYAELRLAYTKTAEYSPYGGVKLDLMPKINSALDEGDFRRVLELSEKIMEVNYVDIDAHIYAAYASDRLGDGAGAKRHYQIAESLMDSVFGSGDGKTTAGAFDVISTDEEYAIINASGLEFQGQALVTDEGGSYDKMTVHDPKSDTTFDIYFCVNVPLNWLGENLKETEE